MSSNERIVDVVTPLGEALWFRQMRGTEALSCLFEFDVVFHSKQSGLSAKAMLGKDVTLKVETEGGKSTRYFNGTCTRFGSGGREGEHLIYTAKLRPWLWLASRRSDCKIFQFQKVPDIISEVLGKYGFALLVKLKKTYREWDYCVQYQETDLNFVMRLMEHEGIYFYFEHAEGNHKLVLVDEVSCHAPLPGKSTIKYYGQDAAAVYDEEHFASWQVLEEVNAGEYITDDYDFENPRADLATKRKNPLGHNHDSWERYMWPGGYVKYGDGENYAGVRIESLEAEHERTQGNTTVRTMAPGYLFTLERCPRADQNREYLSVAANYFFRDNARMSAGSGEGEATWNILVTAQPTSIPYRPQPVTAKPVTNGPQTAVVVGPAGEEIHTDKYSRIKVHFFWDRHHEKNDENSSCWIRVATPWAGQKWGMIQIPRIGQEVVVDFIGGDPDYPLIIGSVYNGGQPTPYELDKYEAFSTWKSHTTPGGGPADFNELRFDDRKSKEQVFIHAQRRMDVRVKKNKYETVQGNSQTSIGGAHKLTIGDAVDLHAKDAIYAKLDGLVDLGIGKDLQFDVGGSTKLHIAKSLELSAESILLQATSSVTLKCGGSYIKVSATEGVTIQAPSIKLNCGGGTSGAGTFLLTEPLDADAADIGTPGYLDNRPRGGGGAGRRTRVVSPARARAMTTNADGSVNYGGAGIRISGSPSFVDSTVATLDSLDGTQTGHQLINNLESNGHTVSIVQDDAASAAGGGGLCTTTTANGFPAGTRVNMGDDINPNTQVSDGSGSDSTVNWKPGNNAQYTDASGNMHTQPDEALLGHELNHADHNANGNNRAAIADPREPNSDQEESTTIGINDHAEEPVSENNILRDMGEDWRRTDHGGTARSVP
ncbi:MAG: type VI secretion system tip protein TssI/VgrG [Rhodoferax sp.]